MEIKNYNIINVGIGGQGVIRAIQILSHAALIEGFKVRTAETHGMAQRGGSVISYLRFGTHVEGPLIPRGFSDVILAFEASEAVRNFNYAGKKTLFLINREIIVPPMVHQVGFNNLNFDEIKRFLSEITSNVYFIDANELAIKAGDLRTMNVVMLGVLYGSGKIPMKKASLEEAISIFVPRKALEFNKNAFYLGIEKGNDIRRLVNE